MYICFSDQISYQQLLFTEKLLNQFYKDFQHLYGELNNLLPACMDFTLHIIDTHYDLILNVGEQTLAECI